MSSSKPDQSSSPIARSFRLNNGRGRGVGDHTDKEQKDKQSLWQRSRPTQPNHRILIVRPSRNLELEVDSIQLTPSGGSRDSTSTMLRRLSINGTHGTEKHNGFAPPPSRTNGIRLDRTHSDFTSKLRRMFSQLTLSHEHNTGEELREPPLKKPTTKNGFMKASDETSHQQYPPNIRFKDHHGLGAKYGVSGKLLGTGRGGSVRLVSRKSDGATFAVKEFREKFLWEDEKAYLEMVTAEFLVGSELHHGNIIETMDLVRERGRWFQVMEYAPYDLFTLVTDGKMSTDEITCSFLQIVNGVSHLHRMGLAHRDLKLENVVVTRFGIMKLIDFGSAVISRCGVNNEVVLTSGIMGSFPYLAPEVLEGTKYNSQAADIWSLAIVYCCMTLRRFPWWQPRKVDASYNSFVSASRTGTEWSQQRFAISMPTTMSGPLPTSTSEKCHCQHKLSTLGTEGDKLGGSRRPWPLLSSLPRQSAPIIGRMLTIDPEMRASMDVILEDEWVKSAAVCIQIDHERVLHAPGHQHNL